MTFGRGDALEQAIALYRAPTRLSPLQQPAPDDALLLLRIAADDRAAIAAAEQATGHSVETISGAAVLYIQHVLFVDSADAYRLLGVRPDANEAQIKEHYRWLMRWLHPDRRPERWEVVYSDRVNRAWQSLRSRERRAAYDLSLQSPALVVSREPQPLIRRNVVRKVGKPLLSTRTKRRLPRFILGGLVLGACMVLGLMYDARDETPMTASQGNEPGLAPQPATPQPATPQPVVKSPTATAVVPVAAGLSAAATPREQALPFAIAGQPATGSPREAADLLSKAFMHAYGAGDLGEMRKLFGTDADNDHGGLDAIMQDYGDLFRETRSRELRLERLTWTTGADRVVGSGPFQATIQWRGNVPAQRVDGWITIDARRIDGQWRIQRIVRRSMP